MSAASLAPRTHACAKITNDIGPRASHGKTLGDEHLYSGGFSLARSEVWRPAITAESRIRRDGRTFGGARNRGQHRYFHAGRPDPAAAASGGEPARVDP